MRGKKMKLSTTGGSLVLFGAALVALAGSALFLPILPAIATALELSTTAAQWTTSAFNIGLAIGLIGFGKAASSISPMRLIAMAMGIGAVAAAVIATTHSFETLLGARFVHGFASAAAPALVPAWLLATYGRSAAQALARLSSVEALAPALAPLVAVWLLDLGGWRLPVILLAGSSISLAILTALLGFAEGPVLLPTNPPEGNYLNLIGNGSYACVVVAHALTTSGLLVLVSAAPFLFARTFGVSSTHFAAMQSLSILAFIIAANAAPALANRAGEVATILMGTVIVLFGQLGVLLLSIANQSPL